MKIVLFCLVFIFSLLVFDACKAKKTTSKDPSSVPAAQVPTEVKSGCDMGIAYNSHVKAIIDNSCALSCHSALKHFGGIDLSNYENVKAEAIKTRFMGALKHEPPYEPMPKKNPKLSDSTLNIINCWILSGTPN